MIKRLRPLNSREQANWFEEVWRYRDEELIPENVGGRSDGRVTTIPYEAFEQLGAHQVDPRWLHCGVLRFPPSRSTAAYSFVTSGLSNAWDAVQPDRASVTGLRIELRVDSESEDDWIVDTLLRLSAMQLLIGAGRFNGRILAHGDRVRLGAGAFADDSSLTTLVAVKTADMTVESGTFSILHLVGITDAERDFAMTAGVEELLNVLRAKTRFPMTDVARPSVL